MRFYIRIAAIPATAAMVMLAAPSAAAPTTTKKDAAPALPALTGQPVHGTAQAPFRLGSGLRQGSYLALATPATGSGNGPGSILWD